MYLVSPGGTAVQVGWGLQRAQQKPAGARAMIFDIGKLKANSGALWKREGRGVSG